MLRISRGLLSFHRPLILAFHLVSFMASYFLALGLRFEFVSEDIFAGLRMEFPLALLLLFRLGAYTYWELNEGYWRYVSTEDLVKIVKAHAGSSILVVATLWALQFPSFPRSVLGIEFCISILVAGGGRFMVRLLTERRLEHEDPTQVKEVVVLGAGESGHLLIKQILSQRRLQYRPVAVLDDNQRQLGLSVYGVRVSGPLSDLGQLLNEFPHISAVILAIPSLSRQRYEEIRAVCEAVEVPLKRLQSFEDIALQDVSHSPLPALSIESVLERESTVEHESEVRAFIRGRTVMVTGAAGSIGSELVRQILPFGPQKLLLVDNNEFHMFKISREIEPHFPEIEKEFILASVTNRERLHSIFEQFRPQVVFHAAAYKHVPLMEQNPHEAFTNNVIGTRNLLELSRAARVNKFLLISTDKAVNSHCVMGHSKRLAEILTKHFCCNPSDAGVTLNGAIVRFGNVINSNGSVIPLFKEQITGGGPVTITHPEVTRYFMSIQEAVRLVLAAATVSNPGEAFLLDMGKPVRILDVAKKMLALYGRREIPISFIGLRPGEKLHEELTSPDEGVSQSELPKVLRVSSKKVVPVDLLSWVDSMESRVHEFSNEELIGQISQYLRQIPKRTHQEISFERRLPNEVAV